MQDERSNSFNARRDSAQTGGHCDPFGTQNSDFMPRTYEVMRQRNCKTEKFIPFERYSSIRPPVSKCSYDETKNLLLESVDEAGCFEARSKDQDALNVWKLSPYKQSLSYYGVADGLSQPEAVKFNRTLTSSLKHASGSRKRGGRQPRVPPTPQRPPQPAPVCQPYILNRQTLGAELQAMPVVRQKLDPKTALEMVYCEKPPNPDDPLGVDEGSPKRVSLKEALDMLKPEKPPRHGLRRKHWYCPPKCGEQENRCTDFEWAKYKLDPRPYDEAFHKWFLEQKVPPGREPHDYDELYKRFQGCFEIKPEPDPDCVALAKCCPESVKKKKEEGFGGAGGEGGGIGGVPGKATGGAPGGAKGGAPGGAKGGATGGKSDEDDVAGVGEGVEGKEEKGIAGVIGHRPGEKQGEKPEGKKEGGPKGPGSKEKEKAKEQPSGGGDKEEPEEEKGKGKKKEKEPKKGKDKDKVKDKGEGEGDKEKESGKKKKKEFSDEEEEPKRKPPKKLKPPPEPSSEGTEPSTRNFSDLFAPEELGIKEEELERPKPVPRPPEEVVGPPKKKPPPKKPAKGKKDKKGKKDQEQGKGKGKGKGKGEDEEEAVVDRCPPCPPVGCECCICDCLYAKKLPISPAMQAVFAEEKVRGMREYLRQMRHREYMECAGQQPPCAQHKVDPIEVDDCFCRDPKIAEYCDCLGALQHLQKLLGKKRHPIVNNELLFNLEDLRQRIARRMCEGLC